MAAPRDALDDPRHVTAKRIEQSSRIEQLTSLLERAEAVPPAERATFVREACGDDAALCRELESLLEAHDSAGDYFADLATETVAPAYAAVTGVAQQPADAGLLQQLQQAVGSIYRVERELGGGGMSRVFLAEEIKLARKVVIKVLPPAMSVTVNADQFRREIRVAAQLQHPHIVPLLTTDSNDGLLYYTMPFVVGESLRARLAREGALRVADATGIWHDVLDALAHAHANHVVHRDIKPANILLGVRNARVIDFGIARAIEGATGDVHSTTSGLSMGTPAYMAPEQITGDVGADHRVDIYAAGLVMHEMLEGRLPFPGQSGRDLALTRLTGDPAPLVRHDCPPELRDLVLRCLARDPEARPASAEEVLAAIEHVPSDAASLPRRLRKVLIYTAVAMAVVLVATSASQLARGRTESTATAARAARHVPSIAAHEWYLRGMDVALMRTESGQRLGETYFKRAIAEDSNYAAAHAGLVRMYLGHASRTAFSEEGWLARAEQAALKAVSLDDSLAEAHAALGWVRLAQRHFGPARTELERAIALDPRVSRGHEGLARVYMWTGQPVEQLAAARIGLKNDPYSHSAIRELALALLVNNQCDEALERLRPLKALTPAAGIAGIVGGQCYASRKQWPEAVAEFRWALESSESAAASSLLGYALARAGRRDEARVILADLLAGRTNSHGPVGVAIVFAGLGDYDQAFGWLEKATTGRITISVYIMGPMFSELHRDTRFAQLKKSLGI
jgi:serine/threonine protein kinase/tetratricopeptide (TPR) repeat protein